jgi:hypothetical protein
MFNNLITTTLFGAILLVAACNSNTQKDTTHENKEAVSYTKNDLLKIKWIEGKWKGMAADKPFYEIYEIICDSCLKITSFEWNGSDSSNSSIDMLQWKDGAYYLGKTQNYKVRDITHTEIKMIPVKASNDIRWIFKDSASWDAILVGQKSTKNYHMQRFDPFNK